MRRPFGYQMCVAWGMAPLKSPLTMMCGVWNIKKKIIIMYYSLAINLRIAFPCIYVEAILGFYSKRPLMWRGLFTNVGDSYLCLLVLATASLSKPLELGSLRKIVMVGGGWVFDIL